jgi:hypothetical protein
MKYTLAIAALAASAVGALAQGQMQFNNRLTGIGIDAPISIDGANISGTAARAALVGGAVGSVTPWQVTTAGVSGGAGMAMSAHPTLGTTWVTFRTGAAAGYVSVGSAGVRGIGGVPFGTVATVQIVSWTGNYTSFADAVAAALLNPQAVRIGASNPVNVTTSTSASDPLIANIGPVGIQSFGLVVVPEPASASLLGLGLASLLIFRRRK